MAQEVNIRQPSDTTVHLSVVSHGQDELVDQLLESVAAHCRLEQLVVTVTKNTDSRSECTFNRFPFPVTVLQNTRPKGFGANHNQAFKQCRQDYFCVVNPDIILTSDLFEQLLPALASGHIGVTAPVLVDSEGRLQDSARKFPTPGRILERIFAGKLKKCGHSADAGCTFPDWVAGMFMLFPAHLYQEVGGFDERYFMYCEDADICMRLCLKGFKVQLVSDAQAIHDARRASHRTLSHLHWHVSSLLRFFYTYPFYTL